MKQGIISIQPQWVVKIANGTKKGEVRTTAPKEWVAYLEGKTKEKPQPTTWFIYCTKGNDRAWKEDNHYWNSVKVSSTANDLNGKIVGKFTLNRVERICTSYTDTRWFYIRGIEEKVLSSADIFNRGWELKRLCDCNFGVFDYYFEKKVDNTQYGRYRTYQVGYVWLIDNLEMFDTPKELSEFKSHKKTIVRTKINNEVFETELDNSLTKAPQSFMYIEGDSYE